MAAADVFPDHLEWCIGRLGERGLGAKVDVPKDRQFIGFDAYRKAMDCLRPGDIALMATPPAFRWVHFGYAIEKGLNVFMEKPVTVDGPTTRRMLKLADESVAKNLKVAVGLMYRHSKSRIEVHDRIQSGELGEIIALRSYRMHGPAGSFASERNPGKVSDLLYQIQHFHSFLWASGGAYSDFYVHSIDECCWMKNAWPVQAQALGGRHYRGKSIDQNFDTYSVEYTFADGTKFLFYGRTMPDCYEEFASYAHGTKGMAIVSIWGPRNKGRAFKGQVARDSDVVWKCSPQEDNMYDVEWEDLVDAITHDKPYNEVKRGAEASLVTSMGRMAAHTGHVITYDQILNLNHEFAPGLDKLTMDSPPPLLAGPDGKYPVPQPGIVTKREY